MSAELIRQRIILFQILILLSFVVLTVQLWNIQILSGENYQVLAKENRIKSETLNAPRGVIYDRRGRILVRNRPRFRATFLPAQVLNETWLLWEDEEWQQVASTLALIAEGLQVPFPHQNPAEALKKAFDEASGQMLIENIGKLCEEGQLLECYAEGLEDPTESSDLVKGGLKGNTIIISFTALLGV